MSETPAPGKNRATPGLAVNGEPALGAGYAVLGSSRVRQMRCPAPYSPWGQMAKGFIRAQEGAFPRTNPCSEPLSHVNRAQDHQPAPVWTISAVFAAYRL